MHVKRAGRLGLVVFLLVALLAGCGAPSEPHIEVADVWARPAMAAKGTGQSTQGGMGEMGTGAVFMTLANKGQKTDRLVGGKTEVAEVVEIHETVMDGEVMKMRMLPDGLEIPARGQVELRPGGYHIMLIGITRDLKVGDEFAIELQFEQSGIITVEPAVREP